MTPIEPIYLPQNFTDIDDYRKNLSDTQLTYLYDTAMHVYDRHMRRLLGK